MLLLLLSVVVVVIGVVFDDFKLLHAREVEVNF